MKIYNPNGTILYDGIIGDGSQQTIELTSQHNVTIYIESTYAINFQVGCYLDFQAIRYTIRKKSAITKRGERNLEYIIIFESPQTNAEKRTVRNPVDKRLKFPYTASPREHAELIVWNLNQIGEGGYQVGQCIEAEKKTVSYNHTKCLEGVRNIAEAFETEWEFDNKTLHIRKVEYNKDNPLELAYGFGNGFKVGLKREISSVPIEILAVESGSRNIDASKNNGSADLLLPKGQRIKFDGVKFEDEEGFNPDEAREYIVDPEGLTIQRADKELSTYEDGSTDQSEIYPMRVGTITGVEVTTDGFYNIFDATIPEALDYSQCRIDGEKMTVKFETGMLASKEFDIVQTDKALTGYNHSLRRFMLVSTPYDGQDMPNDTWKPVVGDKYAVFGMMMPDSYIRDDASKSGASWDMFRASVRVLYEEEQDTFTFTGELDGNWAKRSWVNIGGKIKIGGYVRFTDTQMVNDEEPSVLIRQTGIVRYINNPYKPNITLANAKSATYASDFRQIPQNEVIAETQNRETLNFARRGFRDARETALMLQNALLNFTEGITPITVQTMQLLVGDESLQFKFVTSKSNPHPDTNFHITFDKATKQLKSPASIAQHMTLGINNISSSHSPLEYKFWTVSTYTSAVLDQPDKKYFLYLKAPKNPFLSATFILSETAIGMESVSNYYHFLAGILNTEYEGDRSFAPMYGFTEILPGQITTDRIVSSDGNNYIDLAGNKFRVGDNSSSLDWNVSRNNALSVLNALISLKEGTDEIRLNPDTNSIQYLREGEVIGKWTFSEESSDIQLGYDDARNYGKLKLQPEAITLERYFGAVKRRIRIDTEYGITLQVGEGDNATKYEVKYDDVTGKLIINAVDLPTSPYGLPVGQVWLDNGVWTSVL